MKKTVFSAVALLLALSVLAQPDLAPQLALVNQHAPFEKLYLQTDHTVYAPGETVFLKGYLTGGDPQRPVGTNSHYIYVELLDPKGKTIGNTVLYTFDASQMADGILLPAGSPGGVYVLRAYSEMMKNYGEDAFFEKKLLVQSIVRSKLRLRLEVERTQYQPGERLLARLEALSSDNQPIANTACKATVAFGGKTVAEQNFTTDAQGKTMLDFTLPQDLPSENGLLTATVFHNGISESVARPVPVAQKTVMLAFFPEGGDLSLGHENRVAFEATDPLGNPVDCRGILVNGQGGFLTNVESYHKGMGSFRFEPKQGENYFVKLEGQAQQFPLPAALPGDFSMQVEGGGWFGSQALTVKIWTKKQGQAWLVMRMGEQVWEQSLSGNAGEQTLEIPIADLPPGILQLTVFDENKRPHCERLAFVNPQKQVHLKVTTDKETYLPREQVNVTIEATDPAGKPVAGQFSAAVVEDNLWAQVDDKQDNILSRLLLTSELKGFIEEPSFYFDTAQAKAPLALDLLMRTHGWRRFGWKDFLDKNAQETAAFGKVKQLENSITGKVYFKNKIAVGAEVWVEGTDRRAVTDEKGKFVLNAATLVFPVTLKTSVKSNRGERTVTKPNLPPVSQFFNTKKKEGLGIVVEGLLDEKTLVEVADTKQNSVMAEVLEVNVQGLELSEVVVVGYGSMVSRDQTSQGLAITSVTTNDHSQSLGDNLYLQNSFHRPNWGPEIYQDYQSGNDYRYRRQYYAGRRGQGTKGERSDFRKTVHWQGNIATTNGKAAFSFLNSDEVSTFRIITEGLDHQGFAGRSEKTFATQLPFSAELQLPQTATFGDTLFLEILLRNNSEAAASGFLKLEIPEKRFVVLTDFPDSLAVQIGSKGMETVVVPLLVPNREGLCQVKVRFSSGQVSDASSHELQIVPKGFLKELYLSEKTAEKSFVFEVADPLDGSLQASFSAYPHLLSEMAEGLSSIVREPYGCFEQVSSSNYPNIMALQFLQENGLVDFDFQKQARRFLETGYKKLSGYETPQGGFSLYGSGSGDVRLTAYGLLQFWDMKEVYDEVSGRMIDRTLEWLWEHKPKMEKASNYYQFNRLFALYAFSEMAADKHPFFQKNENMAALKADLAEFDEQAIGTKDPYFLAMTLAANANAGRSETTAQQADRLLHLLKLQAPGKFATEQTFMLSYGKSQQVETAAWAAFALLKSGQGQQGKVRELLDFLQKSKDGRGGFGSTQATVMALKALKEYARFQAPKSASGQFVVNVNGHTETVVFSEENYKKLWLDLAPHFQKGKNSISIRQNSTGELLPFTVQANWRSMQLPDNEGFPLSLTTELSSSAVDRGGFVRLSVEIRNEKNLEAQAPLAIIGIPAGLSFQPWQLRDLAQQRLFDFFEIKDNCLVAYYEKMGAGEVRKFQLDLKADVAGNFEAPASVVYPYYTAEEKFWVAGEVINIER